MTFSFFFVKLRNTNFILRKEVNNMTLSESILIAIFCMAVVFTVLGMLWAIIRLFSIIILAIEHRKEKTLQ